jgi:hypothetical protein
MKKTLIILFIAANAALVGCTSTSVQHVSKPDLSVPIPEDKAVVELHRPSSMVGAVRGADIYDNNMLIGNLKNGSSLLWGRGDGTLMCLSVEQFLEKAMGSMILLVQETKNPNCLKVEAGKVNKVEFNYIRGTFALIDNT